MTDRPAHPLDVDLADLVDGLVEADRAAELEAHVDGCLLCRIKRQRLRKAPPATLHLDRAFDAPRFPIPPLDAVGAAPATGELWLAGAAGHGDDRLLVLVLRTSGDRPLVAPVTFDVEAADDETSIVDDLAIYPRLATELPRSLLIQRVRAGLTTAGATAGPPIAGATDPRLEVRQCLADRLGSMEAARPGPRAALMADLRELRGRFCAVRALEDWGDVALGNHARWVPLFTIDEVGVVLVVLDTPHGLADDGDFNVARAVLTRFNATGLVVLSSSLSDSAEVFDAPSLNYGVDAPSGRLAPPRPLIAGLSPFDAISKFLDQTSGAKLGQTAARPPVERVDVNAVLREAGAAALAGAARQASRFKITPKRRGYESAPGMEAAFQAVLARALDGEEIGGVLVALAAPRPAPEPDRDER